jgi:tetratricopeptide (TPR) repeat protein
MQIGLKRIYSRTTNVTHKGDVVVSLPDYIRVPLDYYYNNTSDGTVEYGASTADELERLRSLGKTVRIFFASTDDISAKDPSGRASRWLQNQTSAVTLKPRATNKTAPVIRLYLAINESNPLDWHNKGISLYKAERYNESLQAYNRAIEIAPDFASARYNKGLALRALGRIEESNATIAKALAIAS